MAVLQAVELLRRRLAPAGELDGPQLKQLLWLARELECWPLALELAAARVRYGYERLHTLLVREGWQINLKRVYRLYHEEGLSLRLKNVSVRPGVSSWLPT